MNHVRKSIRASIMKYVFVAVLAVPLIGCSGGGGDGDGVTGDGGSGGSTSDRSGWFAGKVTMTVTHKCAGETTPVGPEEYEAVPTPGSEAFGPGCVKTSQTFSLESKDLFLTTTTGLYKGAGTYEIASKYSTEVRARGKLCAEKCNLTVNEGEKAGSFSCTAPLPDGSTGTLTGTFECTDVKPL